MKTNIKTGLSSREVEESIKKYGKNIIENKKRRTFINLVIESLSDPIIKILIIALGIKLLFLFSNSDIYETLGIVVAIFLACFISAISEYGSEKAFEKLSKENSLIKEKVLRNSKKILISMDEVVVGDIVYLESGDKVPADGIIVSGEISVDESMLTGETKEKYKNISNNDIYMGSIVTGKNAIIQVTKIGKSTMYGTIALDIQDLTLESPLKSRLRVLAGQISKFGYIAALLVLISYMFNAVVISNNFNINEILKFKDFFPHLIYALTLSVAVVVMAVPEGLPMMITLVLSSNMKRLLKRNVLVKKLVGIETAGSLNILFTDKTGTLTEGKLRVISFSDPSFNEYNDINKLNNKMFDLIYQSLVYNNESFFAGNTIEGGNITDKAILSFVKTDRKDKYSILNIQPFDSKLKYSSVTTNYNGKTIFMKGAYETILSKCNSYINSSGTISRIIDKNKIINYLNEKASLGQRILSLCYSCDDGKSYILLGFLFLKDQIE